MNKIFRKTVLVFAALLVTAIAAQAEYTFFTRGFAIEVSLANAKEGMVRLPIYQNRITALAVRDNMVIGGTTADRGLSPYLFAASMDDKLMKVAYDLDEALPGQYAISSGFVKCSMGNMFAGTMSDEENGSGHLIKVDFDGKAFTVTDLGVPVEGESVYCLALDKKANVIYGLSYPNGKFFSHDLASGAVKVFEESMGTRRDRAPRQYLHLEPEQCLSREIVIDNTGRVFGSMPYNKFFCFDPAKQAIEVVKTPLPEVWGRNTLARVDAMTLGPDGMIYGGNGADGQLFRLNPQTLKMTNLGKPIMGHRMPGLAFGADGRLYGVAGGPPMYAHLFYYEGEDLGFKEGKGFVDLGNPHFDIVIPGATGGTYPWRGYNFSKVIASDDGQWIVLGENEAQSQLMIFNVKDIDR